MWIGDLDEELNLKPLALQFTEMGMDENATVDDARKWMTKRKAKLVDKKGNLKPQYKGKEALPKNISFVQGGGCSGK